MNAALRTNENTEMIFIFVHEDPNIYFSPFLQHTHRIYGFIVVLMQRPEISQILTFPWTQSPEIQVYFKDRSFHSEVSRIREAGLCGS